ncbi:MAG: hypothetical protein AAF628_30735 [Planctomycetota bacterium]
MGTPTGFAILVLFATLGVTLWGGFVLGPRRIVPVLLLFGPLFLPAYAQYDLPGLPPLDRLTAVTLPAAVLFMFSPRECWQRFRFVWADALLLAFVAWSVLCVAVNQGIWAATSMLLKQLSIVAIPYFAGRLYVQQARDVVRLARMAAPFVIVYLGLMLFEARMYPRIQNWLYGSEVIGLPRMGLYRPIVFAQNQLELGHTLVLLTLLMIAVWRSDDEVREAGGRWLVLGILAGAMGVMLSLSRGPILSLLAVLLVPLFMRRSGLPSCALGMAGVGFFVWMLSPAGSSILAGMALVDANSESGQTLFFRFLQIETWKPLVEASPIFGHGESFKREAWQIIDGELLLNALHFGYPGALLLSAFWLSLTWQLGQRCFPRRHVFQQVAAGLAPILGWLIFGAWGDAFIRAPHYLICGGVLGLLSSVRSHADEDSLAANPIRNVVLRYG